VFPEFASWGKERIIRGFGVPYNVKLNNRTTLQQHIEKEKKQQKKTREK
jgi:hypothetical protein